MVRWIGVTLFLATMIVASDCQGQLIGNGLIRSRQARTTSAHSFSRNAEYAFGHESAISNAASPATMPVAGQRYRFPTQAYYSSGQSKISRLIDGPMTHKYRNPAEVDSRYTGGFHQSHFEGIGLPSGDIGLRGNALNWRTW